MKTKREGRSSMRGRKPKRQAAGARTQSVRNLPDKIRVIPLGGVEEIGRNMTVIEYKDDIIVIDAGLQFPEESTPGIDYILPNTKYLEAKRDKIRALVVSHGHLDHIGGIPYLIERLGNPTIYTSKLTKAMILKRQEEFPHAPKLNVEEVKSGDEIKISRNLSLKFFDITHTIPDAIGTIIKTPLGNIIYPGDFKIERDEKGQPKNIEEFERIGKEDNLLLIMESTNAEAPGFSISEETVKKNLEKIFKEAKGRIIVGTFASQIERILEIINIAEKLGRKVFIEGFSLKANLEIARELKLAHIKKGIIEPIERIEELPDEKVLAICTGAQGEENAALMRIANKKHKYIKIREGDTVILSSSIIPGNEKSIQTLKDNLARQGAHIVHYKVADIHASGHAYAEELKMMIKLIKPKFFIPVHGYYFMLKTNADLAQSVGIPKKNIAVPTHNGIIIELDKERIWFAKETAPSNYIMVDGLGVGDVQEVVLRDRQMLSQDGIFVVIVVIDSQTGRVRNSPDIISRGFIYLRESQELLKQVRILIKKSVEEATGKMHPVNISYLKEFLREKISRFLFQKTKRRPMVILVLIEV